ncbi:aurora kinase A- and ninein-interacting protein [Lissotriton helveticus]
MMKTKGSRAVASPSEACGIWLDPSAGKKNGVQALLCRPSLKLSNPFPRRSSSAVMEYDFTQTRSPQPCTLQTTISSFFRTTPPAQMLANQTDVQASANIGLKRKGAEDELESSNKKRGTLGSFSTQQPVDDSLSVTPHWRQKCNPLTEAIKRISNGSSVRDSPSKYPQTTLSNDSPIEMESNEMQSLVYSHITESQDLFDPESQFPTLLPNSHRNLPRNPDAHLESLKLLNIDILVKQTNQDCEHPLLQPLSPDNHAHTLSPQGSSCVEGSQTQIDFTQDSEGNMVLAHRATHGQGISQQSNRRECSVSLGTSGIGTKKENLDTTPHNNSLANICAETKGNLLYWKPSKNSSNIENINPVKMRASKENVKLNCVPGENTIHQAKHLHYGCEGIRPSLEGIFNECEGSDVSSSKNIGNTVRSTRCFSNKDISQGCVPNKTLKYLVNTKARNTPLGDRTNEIQEGHGDDVAQGNFRPPSEMSSRLGNSPMASQPLASLLFTQDSEGNAVIKHW